MLARIFYFRHNENICLTEPADDNSEVGWRRWGTISGNITIANHTGLDSSGLFKDIGRGIVVKHNTHVLLYS